MSSRKRPSSGAAQIFAAAFMIASGTVSAVAGTALSAGASTSAPAAISWAGRDVTALLAAASVRGDGPLTLSAVPGPVSKNVAQTLDGPVSATEQTLVATDRSGPVVVGLTLLGGVQLMVSERSVLGDDPGAVAVLAPGSTAVTSVVNMLGVTTSSAIQSAALQPATSHGCAASPSAPIVTGSHYGPLIDGQAFVHCTGTTTISIIASLYRGGTHVGTTSGGSGRANQLLVSAYGPCKAISGSNKFNTQMLWKTSGQGLTGSTSHTSSLHCS